MTEERRRIVISVYDLIRMILHFFPVIMCWALFCGTLLYCHRQINHNPVYTAETSIYVLSRTAESDYGRLDVSDLDVSKQMIFDAKHVLGNEQTAEKVLANLKGDAAPFRTISTAELLHMVDIRKEDDSLLITIAVSGSDPYVLCEIANTYREVAIAELDEKIMARGVQTVQEALIPLTTSGRPAAFYAIVGLFIGLISAVGLITIVYIIRFAHRDAEDIGEI